MVAVLHYVITEIENNRIQNKLMKSKIIKI